MKKKKRHSDPSVANKPHNYTSFYIVLPDGGEDPNPLSEQLGLVPTRIQIPPVNTLPPASWILRIHDLPLPNDCQEHLDWLFTKLKGKEDFIKGLRDKGYWVGVICHWYSESGKPELASETVNLLEDLEMCLDFELERWE
jgi:hypothetical protein